MQDAYAQEIGVCTTVHLPLDSLESVHMPLYRTIAPWKLQGGLDARIFLRDAHGESLQLGILSFFKPRIESRGIVLSNEPYECVGGVCRIGNGRALLQEGMHILRSCVYAIRCYFLMALRIGYNRNESHTHMINRAPRGNVQNTIGKINENRNNEVVFTGCKSNLELHHFTQLGTFTHKKIRDPVCFRSSLSLIHAVVFHGFYRNVHHGSLSI